MGDWVITMLLLPCARGCPVIGGCDCMIRVMRGGTWGQLWVGGGRVSWTAKAWHSHI